MLHLEHISTLGVVCMFVRDVWYFVQIMALVQVQFEMKEFSHHYDDCQCCLFSGQQSSVQ